METKEKLIHLISEITERTLKLRVYEILEVPGSDGQSASSRNDTQNEAHVATKLMIFVRLKEEGHLKMQKVPFLEFFGKCESA